MAEAVSRAELDLLAAEYVMGLLEADDRASTASLIDGNGTMRLLVGEWETRFAPLNAAYMPVPAPDVWPALDAQFFAPRRRRNRLFLFVVAGLAVVLAVKLAFWMKLLH